MITIVVLYIVIGVLSLFTTMVIGKVLDCFDEFGAIIVPAFVGVLWPIAIPLALLAFTIWLLLSNFNKWADNAARRIKIITGI